MPVIPLELQSVAIDEARMAIHLTSGHQLGESVINYVVRSPVIGR
jgi:hypothetical protein